MSDATTPGTHKRIRPFNTKDTYPEQNLDNDLCQAVVAGGVVYLRGQIGQDLDTRESVGIGDVAAQTEKAMSNIAMLLDEAGSSLRGHRQGHRLPHRHPLPRNGVPDHGPMAQRRLPGLDRAGRRSARAPRVAGGDRRHRGDQRRQGHRRMTFSLVARDPATGAFGIVICSSSPAVASRCAHLRATVGVVASQNVTNPALGPRGARLARRWRRRRRRPQSRTGTRTIPRLPAADRRRRQRQHRGALRDATAWACTPTRQAIKPRRRAICSRTRGVITALLAGYASSASAAFEERLLDGLRRGNGRRR